MMNNEPKIISIFSKTMQRLSSCKKTSLLVLPISTMLLATQAYGLAEELRVSGVTKINGRYLINLEDPQGNRNFWLKEGGRSHGYELLEVDQQGGFARIRKNGQTTIVKLKPSAEGVQQTESGKASGPLTLADDAFGKASEAYIKSLFNGGGRDKKLVKDTLSRADYNSKQKGSFELHESRNGLGMAYFQTDNGNYGKLLYTWGIGPKLHLKEIVTFDSRFGKTQVRKAKDIVLQSAEHMDLDDGIGTHPNANGWDGGKGKLPNDYEPDLHFNNIDGETYLRGIGGTSFLFPVDAD
jgi:hypothetical protein